MPFISWILRVPVEWNLLFDGEIKPSMPPIVFTENQQEYTSRKIKKAQPLPSVTPASSTHNLLSKESKIQRKIDITPEEYLRDLQMG